MQKWLLMLVISTAPALANDFAGKWTFDTNVLGNRETVECTFRQESTNLTGSCKGEQFPEARATGLVNDENVQFSFVYLFAGQSYPCTYRGKLNGKTDVSGSIAITGVDGVTGEFRGQKQQEKK